MVIITNDTQGAFLTATPPPQVADFGVAKTMDTLRTTLASSAAGTQVGAGGTAGTLPWKAAETFKGKFTQVCLPAPLPTLEVT